MGKKGNNERLYFLGLQNNWMVTAAMKIKKKHLLLGRKAMTNLDSILKSRDITLPNKDPSSQSYGFTSSHVCMWELGHNNAEHQSINAFELWCWRRLLRAPWTARRSNKSILKEINPEYSLEGLMLKVKLQYFGHLMWRTDSLEETLMLGKIEGRRRGWQRLRWLDVTTDSMDISLSKLQETVKDRLGVLQFMGSQRTAHDWATEQQNAVKGIRLWSLLLYSLLHSAHVQ